MRAVAASCHDAVDIDVHDVFCGTVGAMRIDTGGDDGAGNGDLHGSVGRKGLDRGGVAVGGRDRADVRNASAVFVGNRVQAECIGGLDLDIAFAVDEGVS